MRPKLLKFHENRRPAYWGTWGKTSHSVGPRRPFGKEVKKKNKKKINRFKKCTQSLNRPYSITMSILMTNGKKKLNLVNL
jgi:hypothetical protein